MSYSKLSIPVVAVLSMLAKPAHAGEPELDAGQIASLFPGQYEARIKGYTVRFAGDTGGRLVGRAFGREDHGIWFVQGDSLCVSWRQWTRGQSKCGSIARQGGWLVASNDSGEMLRFKPSRSNPANRAPRNQGGSFDLTR